MSVLRCVCVIYDVYVVVTSPGSPQGTSGPAPPIGLHIYTDGVGAELTTVDVPSDSVVASATLELTGMTGTTGATGPEPPLSPRLASNASISSTRCSIAASKFIKSCGRPFRPCCMSCMSSSTALAAVKEGKAALVVGVDHVWLCTFRRCTCSCKGW